jgi:hypothetical protein
MINHESHGSTRIGNGRITDIEAHPTEAIFRALLLWFLGAPSGRREHHGIAGKTGHVEQDILRPERLTWNSPEPALSEVEGATACRQAGGSPGWRATPRASPEGAA